MVKTRDDIYIDNGLGLIAEKCIEVAILNIKKRKLEKTKKSVNYDLSNWVEDWYWLTDDDSDFPLYCKAAGYKDPEMIINETLRLADARIQDGIKDSLEWFIAERELYER